MVAKKTNEDSEASLKIVQEHALQIWKRARTNAFAHRNASERYKNSSSKWFFAQIAFSVMSIFSVLLLYVIAGDHQSFTTLLGSFIETGLAQPLLTLISVLSSLLALVTSVIQNHGGYDRLHMSHNHNHHSYLYLAQRAREVFFPGISIERAMSILEDLERDFQTLKVRGQEPSDVDFDASHKVQEAIEAHRNEAVMRTGHLHEPNSTEAEPEQEPKSEKAKST